MAGLGRLPKLDVADSIPVSRSKPCRLLLIASGLALLWAWIISFSGGFIFRIGQLRISSRNSNNPLVLALLALAAAWVVAPRGRRWQTAVGEFNELARTLERRLPRLTPPQTRALVTGTAALIAATVVLVGVFRGAFVAGGPDSYGYVSQARLWRDGVPRVELPRVGVLPDGIPLEALVPLGYRLGTDRASVVPIYSPGYPMLMAAVDLLGPAGSMFLVMPFLAGIAVWATYLLGSITVGRVAGMIAALILATSPAFDLQLTHGPMSDIPAMALWTVVLVLLPRRSRNSAFLAGIVAGTAILVRPNLAPLALVPGAFLVWNAAAKRQAQSLAIQRLLLFGIGSAPACFVVAYLNVYWYGSPMASGYGSLAGGLYRWDYFWPNVSDLRGALSAARVRSLSLVWWRRCCCGEVGRTNRVTRAPDRSSSHTPLSRLRSMSVTRFTCRSTRGGRFDSCFRHFQWHSCS
jgi:hypothetical protein